MWNLRHYAIRLLSCTLLALVSVQSDLERCRGWVERGWCLSKPLDMTGLCPSSCETHLAHTRLRHRVSLEDVVNQTVCNDILSLCAAGAVKEGDGYSRRDALSQFEIFSGAIPTAAAHWANARPAGVERETAKRWVAQYIEASRQLQRIAQQRLREMDPEATFLYPDYIHLVCRERNNFDMGSNEIADSHPVHADNCFRGDDDGCRREPPMYYWRTHSAVLFLHGPHSEDWEFEGGEFFYTDTWEAPDKQRTSVQPACGRAVAFSAGPANLHGVNPVKRGRRCAVLSWYTADRHKAGHLQELEAAEALLAGGGEPSEDEIQRLYIQMCKESEAEQHQLKVLHEIEHVVDGRSLTFQVLNEEPQITRIKNFLTVQEAAHLVDVGLPSLEASTVFEQGELKPMRYRTSQTSWISNTTAENDQVILHINERIARLTGLSLDTAEDIQIAFYSSENQGMYEPHFDWGVQRQTMRNFAYVSPPPGGRIATLLIYLNGSHGATVFPRLGLSVRPEPGSALFFYNLRPYRDGQALGDPLLKHGACPVLEGQKYIATRWIHERGNELAFLSFADAKLQRLVRHWENFTTAAVPSEESDLDQWSTEDVPTGAHGDDALASCKDASSFFVDPAGLRYTCRDYARFGYCGKQSAYFSFMKDNCANTCGLCDFSQDRKSEL